MRFDQITIVGIGLIGGSIGLAAKARGVAGRVVGVGRDEGPLADAVRAGAVDAATTDLAAGVRGSDLVVVCTPVDSIVGTVLGAAADCRPETVLTDAGSTKADIVRRVEQDIPEDVHFVGAHPLAGSEKSGVAHARANLFLNRVTVVTRTPRTDERACFAVMDFWNALGSGVVTLDPEQHDRALAITSHLPHAVASGVAGATPRDLLPLTATGFRDVTRVAGGDPDLWAAIFEANRDAVLAALDRFTERLGEFRRALAAGDRAAVAGWLSDAKQVRDALGT